ncbi:MAG: hypothetical protein NVS2B17_21690 [Candidatus Velthaea sp.]
MAHELPGQVPPRRQRQAAEPRRNVAQRRAPATLAVRAESRALVALGYPFWPLALLALFDGSKSPFVKRHALQALGFNAGIYGLWFALMAIGSVPLIGMSAWPLLPLVIPVGIVASVVYGFKAWQGEDVRVPIVTDFIDSKIPVH